MDENELIIEMILTGLLGSLNILLDGSLGRMSLYENLNLVMLAVDELIDSGVILETDPVTVANRVLMRGVDGTMPITDMTANDAIKMVGGQILKMAQAQATP